MPFDWKTLIDVASALAQQAATAASPEAYYRSAVSRAYFGAFGYAFTYSVDYLEYQPRASPDDHSRLRDHLRQRRRAHAAKRLDQLRKLRNEADYENDLAWTDLHHTVESAVQLATQLFEFLPPPRE